MTTKANPSSNDCYAKADPDEPMFTLLGRDATAPFVVLFWCKLRAVLGASTPAELVQAAEVSEAMRDWAVKLGKSEKVALALDAFRKACFEIAKEELEARMQKPEGLGEK